MVTKNPFSCPVWIRSVQLSLPTQLEWREVNEANKDGGGRGSRKTSSDSSALGASIASRSNDIQAIRMQLDDVAGENWEQSTDPKVETLRRTLDTLENANEVESRRLVAIEGATVLQIGRDARAYVESLAGRSQYISVGDGSDVHIERIVSTEDPERVPLRSSLPQDAALLPGSTDVWTIRLGSSRTPFFIPARYHLQLTVIYSLQPPLVARDGSAPSLHSNTTAFTIDVKAALWSVMLGGVTGGIVGSIARSLQDARTLSTLFHDSLGNAVGALLLAIILSGAAIVFAARKSDAQTFVTVEDFWGGLLIGFLVGYSGTAAFKSITRVET